MDHVQMYSRKEEIKIALFLPMAPATWFKELKEWEREKERRK